MRYERDPLSIEYDPVAADLISRAIAARQRKGRNSRVPGWVPALVAGNPLDLAGSLRTHGPHKLSRYELAFQRSLYYDGRIHVLSGGRARPSARWSLKLDWGPVPMLPTQQRRLRVQVFPDSAGRRHVDAQPATESWVNNPSLRSDPATRVS
jgi:hypothetical protein